MTEHEYAMAMINLATSEGYMLNGKPILAKQFIDDDGTDCGGPTPKYKPLLKEDPAPFKEHVLHEIEMDFDNYFFDSTFEDVIATRQ